MPTTHADSRRLWFWIFAAMAGVALTLNAQVLWQGQPGASRAVIAFNLATIAASVAYAVAIRRSRHEVPMAAPAPAAATASAVFAPSDTETVGRPSLRVVAGRTAQVNDFWNPTSSSEAGGMLDEFPSEAPSQKRAS